MQAEIIATLNEIKLAIFALIAIVALGVIASWIRIGISLKNLIKNKLDDLFSEDAKNYYDEGKFDDLLTHCDKKLKKKPNHAYAL